jgi:hypothetical protein
MCNGNAECRCDECREELRGQFEFGFEIGFEGLGSEWLEGIALEGSPSWKATLEGWQTGRATAEKFRPRIVFEDGLDF